MFGFNPLIYELERERYNDLLRQAELARRYRPANHPSGGVAFALGRALVWSGHMLVAAGCRLQTGPAGRQVSEAL